MNSAREPNAPALLFDVFGTLVDWHGSLVRRLEMRGRERGLSADWAELVRAWRRAYPPAMDRVRHGDRAWANLDVLHREALDELLPRFGLGHLSEADLAWFVAGWHRLDPWPDVRAGLAGLRERHPVATLSNGHLALQIELTRHGDLRFDTLFSAEHFRRYKPDPETYLGAAALLGRDASGVMLVASHPSDLEAAKLCGLRTALVRRPLEFGDAEPPAPPATDAFDLTVDDLDELASRLNGDRPHATKDFPANAGVS